MTKPATPLPWKLSGSHRIDIPGALKGAAIAFTDRRKIGATENAAYIVAACNAYPALVEALRAIDQAKYYGQAMDECIERGRALLHELGEDA